MDYSEARAAFFVPREGEITPLDWTSPARRLRDAIEPIATVCYWSEPAYDACAARGLDFLQAYVWGRASVLGEPDPGVVAAAFGVFEPGLVTSLYDSGRATCPLDAIRAARVAGVREALTQAIGPASDAEGLDRVNAALRSAVEALPTTGRPLFAGLAGLPWPDDPWVALWHGCAALREHRGDGHLAAVVSASLDGLAANLVTELWVGWAPFAFAGSRAWSPEAMQEQTRQLEDRGLIADGALTEAGKALRDEIEHATDRAEQPLLDVLGDDLDEIVSRTDAWSQRIVDHGWFPPDPYKRASG